MSPVSTEEDATSSSSSSINSSGSIMRFCVWVPDVSPLETNDPRELLPVEAAGPVELKVLSEAFEAQAARGPDEAPTVACTYTAAAAAAAAAAVAASDSAVADAASGSVAADAASGSVAASDAPAVLFCFCC